MRAGRGLTDALAFLTVVPVGGGAHGGRRGFGTPFFPWVGLLVGAGAGALLALPLPPPACAVLVLIFWTAVTGGLHEDAWADCLDAALAPGPPAHRPAILADPRTGAHGVTGTGLLLLARFAALLTVPPVAAVAAPLVGRWAMVLAPGRFAALSGSGLGAAFAREARPGMASAGGVAGLVLIGVVAGTTEGVDGAALGLRLAGAAVVGLGSAGLVGTFLVRRLGGLNGDGYGALGVAAELAALWAFLPWGTPS